VPELRCSTRAGDFRGAERLRTDPALQAGYPDWIERSLIDRCVSRAGRRPGQGQERRRSPGTQVELLAVMAAKREEVGDFRSAIGALAQHPGLPVARLA
jgi:hypothetical protein